MEQTHYLYLLEHTEREIDKTISCLKNVDSRDVKYAVDRLYDLSLELNTRANRLKHEINGN
jgi:hypothetical protein